MALITVLPTPTDFTRPVADTVAMLVLSDAHVTVRPESTLPAVSFTVAASCTVPPSVTLALGGVMVTEPTGTCATLMVADPVLPPLVPVMVACPALTAVTVAVSGPVAVTVATPVALLENVTVAPGIGLPVLSVTSAVNVTVWPTSRLDDCGEMATALMGTGCTVSVVMADTPSDVAVIVTDPAFRPVAMPV